MTKETLETINRVAKGARTLLNNKYGKRKRLNQAEVWEQATMLRDIVQAENWVKEQE